MASQKGFTLIELLVGLVIGLFLALAIADFFMTSNRSYLLNESRSQVQERGRFAINLLTREIRSSMSWGCLGRQMSDVASHLEGDVYTSTDVQTKFFKSDATELPTEVSSRVRAGSLVLRTVGFSDHGLRVVDHITSDSEFEISNTRDSDFLEINQGDYLLVIDSQCTQGHLIQASQDANINGYDDFSLYYAYQNDLTPGNKDEELSKNYAETFAEFGGNPDYAGRINLFRSSYYFLSEFEGRNYLMVFRPENNQVTRLVPGVVEMLVRAGVGSTGSLNGYSTVDNITDWNSLRSIRLDLLVESDSNAAPGQQVQRSLDGQVHVFENRHAEIFSTVTGIRVMNQ